MVIFLCRLGPTSLNNEFFSKACLEWRERLAQGEFTQENQMRLKQEEEKEQSKIDTWKVCVDVFQIILMTDDLNFRSILNIQPFKLNVLFVSAAVFRTCMGTKVSIKTFPFS